MWMPVFLMDWVDKTKMINYFKFVLINQTSAHGEDKKH